MPLRRLINKTSLRTKVLVPVIGVMGLAVAISMWLANERIKEQIRTSADHQLNSAEVMLKTAQQNDANDLLRIYGNAKNEPRFKAATRMFDPGKQELDNDQRRTFLGILHDLIGENVADVIVLKPNRGRAISVARNPQFDLSAFEINSAETINRAFSGQPQVSTIENGSGLFDVVAIPIFVGDTNTIVGVITFGVQNSLAQKFWGLSQSELILLSDKQVVASTLRNPELVKLLPAQFTKFSDSTPPDGKIRNEEMTLGDEHFLSRAGWLDNVNQSHRLGYLILSSYERPLENLREAQQMIFLVSLLAIVFGAATVWWLVNRAMRPLRELRDSAEAVGRGDFSKRVRVRGRDECGELAGVFNQMTENLQHSRAQLEETVATLKNTQEQLIQSEKLSGIGEFVAGVTHELNNPLAAVMGFSEMLKEGDVDARHRRYLDMIHKSAQRCQKIVQSLLSFARRHQPERKPVSLNNLVESVLEIVNYQLRTSNIEVVTELDPALPVALADPHQIQQVFLNVINNARQALENHSANGKIKIITSVSGQNIRITIQDNGPGIPRENLQRIFDPFFTTKETAKGTGLGLSLCYGIIKAHGGTIIPSNHNDGGAVFVLELPILHINGDTTELLHVTESDVVNPAEGKGKKILVIDDEEAILQMMRDGLSDQGYDVDVAGDGETALTQLNQKHYDVTFCDWKMPGLNGHQVYENLRAKKPELCRRFVFITGDVVNEQMRGFLEQEKRPHLAKPFTFGEIRDAIKSTLAL